MIDLYRSDQARKQREEIERSDSTNPSVQYGRRELLDKAFSKLKPEAKQLILLRDYEGYTYEEISTMTEKSLSSVKVDLYRARKSMQHHLLTLENEVK